MKPLALFIAESRPLPNLIQVINNHVNHVPEGTDLFIYHGRSLRFLKTLFPDAFMTEIENEFTVRNYNELLTSSKFWSQFLDYKKVLVFQHDSWILRHGIEEFLEMDIDYIGASWLWNNQHIGNGGISLRNPKIMYEVCSKFPWNGTLNEDHWLTMHMFEQKIGKLATIEQADMFSVEQKHLLGSWAYHAIEKWQTEEECCKIRTQYENKSL